MHPAALQFVTAAHHTHGPFARVVEVGSRDINGSVRHVFEDATSYVGIDLADGPGVDLVADARDVEPEYPVDCVVCCEVLEHDAGWEDTVVHVARWLRPGGYLIVTCAGPGRRPHSAIDGGWVLHPGEHYGNVPAPVLRDAMRDAGLRPLVANAVGRDTQAIGRRP